MNNSNNYSPKSRPIPSFFAENNNFSTKKEKQTPRFASIHPPRPPIKSCPPISRLRLHKKSDNEGARIISFLNKDSPNDSDIISKHYDEKQHHLFFEQCFIIEGNLGSGSFGIVYKVKCKEDGKYYAIKKSKEKFKGHSDRIRKLDEVAKHEELPPHSNFVKFYRAWEEKQRLYIQTELCDMSLSAYAEKHHNIPEEVIWNFLVDLLQALKHLHDRKLVHMDIKPDNIFISSDGLCKLGDFGLIVDLKKEAQEGDPKYLAPEVLLNTNNISCAADIFSLGMTILELATDLDLPRGGDPWHQLRNGHIPSNLISSLSEDLVEIIMKMIEPNHLCRADIDELLNMSRVKKLIASRRRKLIYSNIAYYFKSVYKNIFKMSITLWYFIIYPWIKFNLFFKNSNKTSNNNKNGKSLRINDGTCTNNESNENSPQKHQTSTPKKLNFMNNLDESNSICNENHMEEVYREYAVEFDHNDEDDNSYLNQMADSSYSFSDNSEFSTFNKYRGLSARKTRTEPPLNKLNLIQLKDFKKISPSSTSPCRTPPWKPATSFNICRGYENSPIAFTRQKLNFDEEDDKYNSDKIPNLLSI